MIVHTEPQAIHSRDLLEHFVFRDQIIDGSGDVALDISYPEADSHLWPTVYLQNIVIRGDWRVGIRLKNCWNATLLDCVVSGLVTEETIQAPKMDIGIDCGNSMDVHVIRPRVTCAKVGVRVEDLDLRGHGEGFKVDGGWLMHVNTGVHLQGFGSGGWPTPFAKVSGLHIAHLEYGIFAEKYCGLHLVDNDLYASHLARWPVGIYLDGCRDVRLSNRHWVNRVSGAPVTGTGIIATHSQNVMVNGNTVSEGLAGSYVFTQSCQRIVQAGNVWRAPEYDFSLD